MVLDVLLPDARHSPREHKQPVVWRRGARLSRQVAKGNARVLFHCPSWSMASAS